MLTVPIFEWLFGQTTSAKLRAGVERTMTEGGKPEHFLATRLNAQYKDALDHLVNVRVIAHERLLREAATKAIEMGVSFPTLVLGYQMASSDSIVNSIHEISQQKLSASLRVHLETAAHFGILSNVTSSLATELRLFHISLLNKLAHMGAKVLKLHNENGDGFLGMVNVAIAFERGAPDARFLGPFFQSDRSNFASA
jgi:hypothetical protein